MKRYLIVAGDPSGDLLAANLVRAMKKLDPRVHITALGGKHLKAGSERFLVDLVAQYAGGFWIPLKKILFLRRVLKEVVAPELAGPSIDEVILVDFYGFNRHVAELARQHGKPVHYYVCPQFWASRPGRLDRIKSAVREFLVLFPFEVEFYKAKGLSATFVGHPLLDPILATTANGRGPRHVEPLIGLLPGSRPHEIKKHLPVMLGVCDRMHASFPGARFILFTPSDLNPEAYSEILAPDKRRPYFLEIVKDEDYSWRSQLDVAVTSSGLETLENALLGVPMVVIYKMHWINYLVARSVITVRHIAIPNILAGRVIVPELIQHSAQSEPIAEILKQWLKNPAEHDKIKHELLALREKFGSPGASERAARVILKAA
jgi:lipid-A-disaccharide synthase